MSRLDESSGRIREDVMGPFWVRNKDFIVLMVAIVALLCLVAKSIPPDNPIILYAGSDSIHLPGNYPGGP